MQDDCPISKQEVVNLIERLRQDYNRLNEESIPTYSQQEINEVYACLQRVYSGVIIPNLKIDFVPRYLI